jgi:hypothetical protein
MDARREAAGQPLVGQEVGRRVGRGQHQGRAVLVARQHVGRLAVDGGVEPSAEVGPAHAQANTRAPEGERHAVAVLSDVGPELRRELPPPAESLRRVVGLGRMEAGRGHIGRLGSQPGGQCAGRWPPGDAEAPTWVVGRCAGRPVLQEHEAQPRPLAPRPFQGGDGAGRLLVGRGLAPDGRPAAPAVRQAIPAPVAGPDGRAAVAHLQQQLADEDGPAEVERVGADAAVVGAAVEAVGLQGHGVEGVGRARLVEGAQEERLRQVLWAGLGRRGQWRGDDGRAGIGGADGRGGGAQQGSVVVGVDRPAPPMAGQVWFVPDDVGVYLVAIATSERPRPRWQRRPGRAGQRTTADRRRVGGRRSVIRPRRRP